MIILKNVKNDSNNNNNSSNDNFQLYSAKERN